MADLMTALRNADAAGDVEAAKRIAAMIKAEQNQAQQTEETGINQDQVSQFKDLLLRQARGEQIDENQLSQLQSTLSEQQSNRPVRQSHQPTDQELADLEKGSVTDIFTGADRMTPEMENLPSLGSAPEFNEMSWPAIKAVLATFTTGDQAELEKIFKKQYGDRVSFSQDAKGNRVVNFESGSYPLNRPGISGQDIPRFFGDLIAHSPAARASSITGATAKSAMGEGALEAADVALGGDFSLGDVALSAGLGGAFKGVENTARSAWRSLGGGSRETAETTARQASDDAIDAIRQSETDTGITQATTDIFQPESKAGRFMQMRGEEVIPSTRVNQQAQRVRAVEGLLERADIDNAARFEQAVFESVRNSTRARARDAEEAYRASSGQLDQLGDVPIDNTRRYAQRILQQELRKGDLADNALVTQMQNYINSPNDMTFNTISSIRSAVGRDLQAARNNAPIVGTRDTGILSQLYSNLSSDMNRFANSTNRQLANAWRQADQDFAQYATGSNKTGVKNLIRKGEATPELVDNLLFSKKRSDLDFLAENLDRAGQQAAGQRVLQRVLEKSTSGGQPLNVNKFTKELHNFNNQIERFFTPAERDGVLALREVLQRTRRAQEASALPPTGASLFGFIHFKDPLTVIPGLMQAVVERPTVRNLIIRRNATRTARERFEIDRELADMLGDVLSDAGIPTNIARQAANEKAKDE